MTSEGSPVRFALRTHSRICSRHLVSVADREAAAAGSDFCSRSTFAYNASSSAADGLARTDAA